MTRYRRRHVDRLLESLLDQVPAVMLVGPRAVGKTTTASRYAATVVRLDEPREAAAFRADPDAALRGLPEPVLLDEWQAVPEVIGAVKRAVDARRRPGRFILAGSAQADLTVRAWPGTGRLVRVPLYGMTVAERLGRAEITPLLDRLAEGSPLWAPRRGPDLRDYVELALRSGFPEAALALAGDARRRWLESYVEQLVARDVEALAPRRDPVRLRRFLEAYAHCSAGVVEVKTLLEAAGINRKTAEAYEDLLEALLVAERLPAWLTNRLKRLVRLPKRYVTDAGLVAGILRVDASHVLFDGDLLGRVLETFAAAQLRAEATVAACRPRLHHLRTEEGRHEVDLVAECAGGGIIGIEVKAHAAPGADHARHLRWLRERVGSRFLAGVVLHTGPHAYELDDRIVAAPIASLWSGADPGGRRRGRGPSVPVGGSV